MERRLRLVYQSTAGATFYVRDGRSTIDLFIMKRLRSGVVRVAHGDWNGASAHIPVVMSSELMPLHQARKKSITRSLLENEKAKARDEWHVKIEIPLRIHNLKAGANPTKF